MLISLLQTPNPVDSAGGGPILSLTEPIIPLVTACASSKVWKVGRILTRPSSHGSHLDPFAQIRDAAGDALTGLVAPTQVPEYCEAILSAIERDLDRLTENEVSN